GNVGIGTTSPTEKLSVIGNLLLNNASGDVGVKLGPTGVEAYIGYVGSSGNLQITPRSGYNTTISSGNVGIGTASPSELLHIAESTGTSTLRSQNDSGSFYFGIDNSTGGTFSTGNYSRVLYSGGAYPMVFATNNAERMRILSNGRVGIGTSSPSARLHLVDTNAQMGILASSSSSTYIQFASATNTSRGFIGNGSGLVTGASNSDFIFRSQGDAVIASGGNTERMRIDSSGDVFIGTTGPTVDTSNFGTRIAGSAPGYIASYRNVSGTQSAVLFGGNAGQVFIRGDGDLENTNNSYGAISDERVKSNIVDASSQIDDIMAVQVRSYTLNETGETHIGVVAQELEASGMSGLVQEDDEGMKSVKYSVLYMKAIKALQEAVTRIETLEAEVAALKGA
ncbi:MAG: tail fiber domain-containing protein, partial [Pseudomonadales bacterium]